MKIKDKSIFREMRESTGFSMRDVAKFLNYDSHAAVFRMENEWECYQRVMRYACFLQDMSNMKPYKFMRMMQLYSNYTSLLKDESFLKMRKRQYRKLRRNIKRTTGANKRIPEIRKKYRLLKKMYEEQEKKKPLTKEG
jgi:hypothetical protein